MKFYLLFNKILINFFNKSALHIACEKQNMEIIKELLACDKLDINLQSILK